MPRARKVGSDRAPTIDEIRRMVDNADIRMKRTIVLATSPGIHLGAILTLKRTDVEPVARQGKALSARLVVHRKEDPGFPRPLTTKPIANEWACL